MTEFQAALVGGVIGGALGVTASIVTSYWGPRMLEQWREGRRDGPRKDLLLQMLSEPNQRMRTLERLRLVTGTTDEECRRLLIEIRARGVRLKGDREGWALISRYGFEQPPEVKEDVADD